MNSTDEAPLTCLPPAAPRRPGHTEPPRLPCELTPGGSTSAYWSGPTGLALRQRPAPSCDRCTDPEPFGPGGAEIGCFLSEFRRGAYLPRRVVHLNRLRKHNPARGGPANSRAAHKTLDRVLFRGMRSCRGDVQRHPTSLRSSGPIPTRSAHAICAAGCLAPACPWLRHRGVSCASLGS